MNASELSGQETSVALRAQKKLALPKLSSEPPISVRAFVIMLAGALTIESTSMGQGLSADSAPLLRSVPLLRPQGREAGFTRLDPAQTGLRFTNQLSVNAVAQNRMIEDGSGVAAGDVDGDGLCDLYFCS